LILGIGKDIADRMQISQIIITTEIEAYQVTVDITGLVRAGALNIVKEVF
jgi:hypothetical protein